MITVTGWASIRAEVRSVDDLKNLVEYLTKHNVPAHSEIDWSAGVVYVDIGECEGEWIECGDHRPPETRYDMLLPIHYHPDSNVDRYGDESRPE